MVGGALFAFAIFQPIKVLPRMRVAPGYALMDQHGATVTSEDGRGVVTLYSFAPLACDAECDELFATIDGVRTRAVTEVDLGEDIDLRFVTIALADDPTADELAASAAASGADGEEWIWVGGEHERVRATVGAGFGIYFDVDGPDGVDFDPGFTLVDGNATIRGEYHYQAIADDADRIVGQLASLGTELRNSSGAAGLAYEAAHLFSCYG